MGTQTKGIAVVGAGRWGNHLVRNFLNQPQGRLVALVDPNASRLMQLGELHDLDSSQVLMTNDWDEMICRADVDGVAIATPASTHADLIRSALQQGKHVLVEKPITLNAQQALELCDLATSVQRQLVVDHTYLFNGTVAAGQKVIQQQGLGTPRYGYASRTHLGPVRQDVDALWDLAIHDIAIFCHWLNEFPSMVQAHGRTWLQPNTQFSTSPITNSLFDHGLSDLVWVTLVYPSGVEVTLHLCWANPDKQRRLCLVGEQGTLIFDELHHESPLILQKGEVQQHIDASTPRFYPVQSPPQTIEVAPSEPLRYVCDHFIDCIQHNRPSSISSGEVGAKFVEILAAITTSLNHGGKAIEIKSLMPNVT